MQRGAKDDRLGRVQVAIQLAAAQRLGELLNHARDTRGAAQQLEGLDVVNAEPDVRRLGEHALERRGHALEEPRAQRVEFGRVDAGAQVGVFVDGLDVARRVDARREAQRLLGLGHFLAQLAHRFGHCADVHALQHFLVLGVELLREVVHQADVKVLPAQRGVPLHRARHKLRRLLLERTLASGKRRELHQRRPCVGRAHVV